jgi:hypothetical protein
MKFSFKEETENGKEENDGLLYLVQKRNVIQTLQEDHTESHKGQRIRI